MNNALPTAFLPRLISKQILISSLTILIILNKLQSLYSIKSNKNKINKRNAQDSGYSSEVEDEGGEDLTTTTETSGNLGKDDTYERTFTKEWLLKIIRRGEEWIEEVSSEEDYDLLEEERNRRIFVVEQSSSLVASLSETSESGSISRPLTLPTSNPLSSPLNIILHDALPSDTDPSSVGVQSWGASIILAKMMAKDPERFGMNQLNGGGRMLELGAGTGLLSLVWRGMLEKLSEESKEEQLSSATDSTSTTIVATDYHPTVLSNLSHNISLNTHADSLPIQVLKLDWSAIHSSLNFANTSTKSELVLPTPFDSKFDTLLAADVVYGPEHALWLKSCAICFLKKPTASTTSTSTTTSTPLSLEKLSLDATSPIPTFHLIVPLRPTHTAAIATITEVFPMSASLPIRENDESSSWRMAIKNIEEIDRIKGIGRADEGGYRLYNIGWC